MKFYILSSNHADIGSSFKSGKTLCVYFETEEIKALYGLDDSAFANAERFGVNLSEIDALIVPSGRECACNNLRRFLKENAHAKIYGRTFVFEDYYKKGAFGLTPCGIPKLKAACADRFVPVEQSLALDTSILLFATPPSEAAFGTYFRLTKKKVDGVFQDVEVLDDFSHELNVAVVTNSGAVLLANESHSGLKGVLRGASVWKMQPVYAVIGYFKIFNRVETNSTSMIKKEVSVLSAYRDVRLCLDNIRPKTKNELQKVIANVSAVSVGDVLETR